VKRSFARTAVGTALLVVGATLLTGLYDPFRFGKDEGWVMLVVFGAVLVGLGAALPGPLVFAAPVGLSVGIAATAWGTEPAIVLILGIPAGLALVGLGRFSADVLLKGQWAFVAGPLLAVALACAVWAASEQIERAGAEALPAATQSQLPINGPRVPNVCNRNLLPAPQREALLGRFDLLIEELESHPESLVSYTYVYSDGPNATKDITVRELGEEVRSDLAHSGGATCAELRERLDAVLE
jgi:hypothetical protein